MAMDDLETARRRRLAELQAQQSANRKAQPAASAAEAATDAQRSAEDDAALERLLQQVLEPDARERLVRVRMSRPDLAMSVIQQLVGAAQNGRLARRVSDADLKQILTHLQTQDRDIKITRK